MLQIGDIAFDVDRGVNVKVLERIEAWGFVSYHVFDPAAGRVYKVAEEQLGSVDASVYYDENYLRYVTLLSKIRTDAAGQIGIENIRQSRLKRLQQERDTIEKRYKKGKQVFPDFRLALLVKLEA